MSRTIAERVKDWRWWGEQVLHFLCGGSIAAVCWWAPWWAAAGFGSAVGVLREVLQNYGDEDNNLPDSIADAFFWSLGAIVMSLVF